MLGISEPDGLAFRKGNLVLALLTIVIRDKWDVGFSLTSTAYTGLYTDLGSWFLPLTLGSLERSISKHDMACGLRPFVSVTVMSHLFIGLLSTRLICLAITEPSRIKKRA